MIEKKKFCNMTTEERTIDIQERIRQYNLLELPGQFGMHMGTTYLINDLWRELQALQDHD